MHGRPPADRRSGRIRPGREAATDGRRKDLLRVLRRHRPGRRRVAPVGLVVRLRQRRRSAQATAVRGSQRPQPALSSRGREPHGRGRRAHPRPARPGDGVVPLRRSEPGGPLSRSGWSGILDVLRVRQGVAGTGRPPAAAGTAGERARLFNVAPGPRLPVRGRNAGRPRLPARRPGARRPPLHAAEPTPGVRGRDRRIDLSPLPTGPAAARPASAAPALVEDRSPPCVCRPAG